MCLSEQAARAVACPSEGGVGCRVILGLVGVINFVFIRVRGLGLLAIPEDLG